ncbi:MAG: metal ABC transporter permease [Planctomycetes bacterium]|nr:metal ABC transporter permease [Planctomycetota bacterium]
MNALIDAIGDRNAGQYIATLGMAAMLSYLGLFTVLRRIVFTGVALTQLAAAGVATSFFIADGAIFPLALRQFAGTYGSVLGSLGMSIAGAFGLAARGRVRRLSPDAFVGIVFVTASAIAVLAVWKSARGLAELRDILAGEVLLSRPDELFLLWIGLVVVAIVHGKKRREFWLVSFDPEFASSLGQKVWRLELLFLGSLAVAIALSLRAAGLMLVFAFLLLPPLSGLNLARRLAGAGILAAASGLTVSLVGFLIAFRGNLPVAPTIVICAVLLHLLSLPTWRPWRSLLALLVLLGGLAAIAVGAYVFPMPGAQGAGFGAAHNHGPPIGPQGPTRDQLKDAALARLTGETDAELRLEAARALEDLQDSRATEALARALLDEDPRVREAVARALLALKPQFQPARSLARMRTAADPETRMVAALGQVAMEKPEGVEGLISCLADEDTPALACEDFILPTLARLAGRDFAFDPFADAAEKTAALDDLRAWWRAVGPGFRFPGGR